MKTGKILHQPLSCCLDDIEMGRYGYSCRTVILSMKKSQSKQNEKNINLLKTRTPYGTYLCVFRHHHGTLRAKSSHHHLRPSPIVQMLRPDFCDYVFFVVPLPPRWSLQPWRVFTNSKGLNLPLKANGIGKLLELCRLLGVSFMSWFQNPPHPKKQTDKHTQTSEARQRYPSHIPNLESSKQTWKGHGKNMNETSFQSFRIFYAFHTLSNIKHLIFLVDLPSCPCPALPRHCHHRWLHDPTWSTNRFIFVV